MLLHFTESLHVLFVPWFYFLILKGLFKYHVLGDFFLLHMSTFLMRLWTGAIFYLFISE